MVRTTRIRSFWDETGSEILQLALTMPILIGLFGVTAQLGIWTFSAIQFTTAAEAVAYQADLGAIAMYGEESEDAKSLLAGEIAQRMIGVDASDVTIDDIQATTDASSHSASIDNETTDGLVSRLTKTDATGTLAFTARYRCPSLVSFGEPLVLEHRWMRDRLLMRNAEVE